MSWKKTITLLSFAGLLMLATFACSVFDDDEASGSSSASSVAVYGTDDPGDVTSLRVELIDVRIFTSPDDAEGMLLTPESGSSTVDLVEAAKTGTPGLFGTFGIEPGTYQCASGTLSLVDFTFMDESDSPVTCTSATNLPSSISTEKLCLPRPITIGEGERHDLVFDLPILSGSGDTEAGCQLMFDHARRRIARLADM